MPFPFLALLAFQVVLFVLGQLLAPKPDLENARPAGLGDFQFPTADESRSIPVVWGKVRLAGPNVIWYGDLQVSPIREKVKTGLFSSSRVTVGFEYKVGIDFLLCYGPIGGVTNIRVGERPVFSGTVGGGGSTTGATLAINEPTLFGDRKKGGGLVGDLQVYDGVENQQPDTYLTSVLTATDVPGYVDVAHCVWRGGDIGETERIEPWEFEVQRYPDNLALTGSNHIVNGVDCNPAEALYEVLTDQIWGLGIDTGDVDLASFQAAGETLFTEGNGFSFVLTSATRAEDVADEILRQIDGVVYQTANGQFTLVLARDDYTVGTLPIYDDADIEEVRSFSRAALGETQNNVEIEYTDRSDNYKTTAARAQDLANVRTQAKVAYTKLNFPGVKDNALARDLAARELRQLSFPVAKATLRANRNLEELRPGDVFRWTWPKLGITELVMRVASIDQGRLQDNSVIIECFEDIFALGTALFGTTQPTGWTPTTNDPAAATIEVMRDSPYWFILTDDVLQGIAGERSYAAAARPNGVTAGYTPFVDRGDGSGFVQASLAAFGLTPTGLLDGAYPEDTDAVDATGFTIDTVVDGDDIPLSVSALDIAQFGFGLILIEGATAAGDELVAYETVVDNMDGTYDVQDVHRGLLDTVPANHLDNARVWFVSVAAAVSDQIAFGATEGSIDFKHRTESTTRNLDLSSATALPFTFDRRAERPLLPGNFQVESQRYPERVDDDDILFTWAHRNRLDPLIRDQDDPDTPFGADADVEYELELIEPSGPTTLRTVVLDTNSPPPTGGTWTSYNYLRTDQTSDNGGVAPAEIRSELKARFKTGSLESRLIEVRQFDIYDLQTNSIDFNGTDEFMRSANVNVQPETTGTTFEAWVKRTDSDTVQRTIWDLRGGNNRDRIHMFRKAGTSETLQLILWNNTGSGNIYKDYEVANALPVNTWVQVLFTLDIDGSGDPLRIYIDGSEVTPTKTTDGTTSGPQQNRTLTVGADNGGSNLWEGRIATVTGWGALLSDSAITEQYNSGDVNRGLNFDFGNYTNASDLAYWFRLGAKPSPDLGTNFANNPPLTISLDTNSQNITDADRVADVPT